MVAFGGQSFLVVWVDDRSGTSAIFGTRVSQSGTILDPDGIAISTVAGDKSLPTVASDDAGFLVVWADRRNGEGDIFGARVSQSGSVLDPDGVAISTASGAQDAPAVAFDGSNYMEVWVDGRNGGRGDIYGARVSPSGVVLDPDGLAVSVRACQHRSPAIASDGANFFAVWDDRRNDSGFGIYGARVSAAGTVLDTGGIGISEMTDHQSDATVAFDGSNFLVVWCNSHSGANIFGARVNQSGIVLDSSGFCSFIDVVRGACSGDCL